MQMQASLSSSIVGLGNGSRMARMTFPSGVVPRLERRVGLRVRCMAEEAREEPKVDSTSSKPSSTISSSTPEPIPKPEKKVRCHE